MVQTNRFYKWYIIYIKCIYTLYNLETYLRCNQQLEFSGPMSKEKYRLIEREFKLTDSISGILIISNVYTHYNLETFQRLNQLS